MNIRIPFNINDLIINNRSFSKIGFWFKIKADPPLRTQAY